MGMIKYIPSANSFRKSNLIGENFNNLSHNEVKSEYVTAANVEIDQRTTFEGAMKLFRREVNNSNVINEMKRRRYHEEAWMTRRRKEKERSMRAKAPMNVT